MEGEITPKAKYDWVALKQEFFNSDFLEVAPFIRERLGKETDNDTNVANQTKGWAEAKKEWKRKQIEEVENKTRGELVNKMKVKVEELMTAKKVSFRLLNKYLDCYVKQVKGKKLKPTEKNFMGSFPIDIDKVIKWIQIELGEPTNIAQIQGNKEKPLILIDIIRQANKSLKDVNQPGSDTNITGTEE